MDFGKFELDDAGDDGEGGPDDDDGGEADNVKAAAPLNDLDNGGRQR